jgi:hypothetical protein
VSVHPSDATPSSGHSFAVAVAVVVAACVALTVGLVFWWLPTTHVAPPTVVVVSSPPTEAAPLPASSSPASPSPASVAPPTPFDVKPSPSPTSTVPASVTISSLSVTRTPVVSESTVSANGLLSAPDDPRQLGWYRLATGTTVIIGHIGLLDGCKFAKELPCGPIDGALHHIDSMKVGQTLVLTSASGTTQTYVVTVKPAEYGKGSLPAAYFTAAYNNTVLLMTCGGTFNKATGHYEDNFTVLLKPKGTT